MADKIKGITIELGADITKYNKGLQEAGTTAESTGSKLSSFASKAGTVAAGALAAVGTAAVSATTAMVSQASAAAEYGDNIDKMSQKLGISAEAYQEWDFIAQHSGTSMESLKTSFKTLANAAQDGKEGFTQLGISLEDAASMSTEDLFNAVIAGLQDMEEGTERTAIASELLGKGATELGALLNTSAEDTEAMREQVHELGGVMSDDSVKAAAAYQDSLQNMQTAMSGLTRNLVSDFLPEITSVMDGITELLSGNVDEGTELISQGVNDFADKLIEGMPGVLDSMSEILLNLLDVIIDNLPKIIEMGVEIIVKLAVGLIQAIPDLIAKIPEIIKAIVEGFASYDWGEIGDNIMKGLVDGLTGCLDTVITAVKNVCKSIKEKFCDFFGIESPSKWMRENIGGNLMKGLDVGFKKYKNLAVNSAENVSEAVAGAFAGGVGNINALAASQSNTANLTLTTPVYLDGRVIASVVNQQLGVLL